MVFPPLDIIFNSFQLLNMVESIIFGILINSYLLFQMDINNQIPPIAAAINPIMPMIDVESPFTVVTIELPTINADVTKLTDILFMLLSSSLLSQSGFLIVILTPREFLSKERINFERL